MDLVKAIRDLQEEKKRLDAVIASLEQMLLAERRPVGRQPQPTNKRRGRKGMSREERQQVSSRMKKYWATRRKAAESASSESHSEAAAAGGPSSQVSASGSSGARH